MNPYVLVIALGLVALLQVSFLPALLPGTVTPDVMMVLVVEWALLSNTRSAALWALIGGLWLDLLGGGPFGSYTLALLAVAAVAGLGGGTVYRTNLFLPVVLLVAGLAVRSGLQLAILLLVGRALPSSAALAGLLLPELGLDGIAMVATYPLLAWISRVSGQERLPLE